MSLKSFFHILKSNANGTISFSRQFSFVKVAIGVFALYIFLFSVNSFIIRGKNRIKMISLQREIGSYKQESEDSKAKLLELNSNKENLEKFAREQYFMKKQNEDIYIIE